jgi:hypothetical protein
MGGAMKFFTRKTTVPESNKTREVDGARLWAVRWVARDGEFMRNCRWVMRAFPVEQDAKDFAEALKKAFALIQHTGPGTGVDLEEMK